MKKFSKFFKAMLCVSALIGLMAGCPTDNSDGGGGSGSSSFSGNQTGFTFAGPNGFLGTTHIISAQVYTLNANGSIVPLPGGAAFSFSHYYDGSDIIDNTMHLKALSTLDTTASVSGGKLSLSLGTPWWGTVRADNYAAGFSAFSGATISSPSAQIAVIHSFFYTMGSGSIFVGKPGPSPAEAVFIWADGYGTIKKPSDPQINITVNHGWNMVVTQYLDAYTVSSITSADGLDGFGWLFRNW